MALGGTAPAEFQAIGVLELFGDEDGLRSALSDTFGEDGWMEATVKRAGAVLGRQGEDAPDLVVVGVDADHAASMEAIGKAIEGLKKSGAFLILVVQDLNAQALHTLMRAGADEFLPYPAPDGALADAVRKVRSQADAPVAGARKRKGRILPVYHVAGGAGASTFAVNLAWELAQKGRKSQEKTVLLDLDFQYGSTSTYLDLQRREAIFELISNPSALDDEGFQQVITDYRGHLSVMTPPSDALPLDIATPNVIGTLLKLAAKSFDNIVIDMPLALTPWSDLVLSESTTFYVVSELDMRSAQNMMRFLRILRSEDLPLEKVQLVLNRSPGFWNFAGKTRAQRIEESLGIPFAYRLPDGGEGVVGACDQGAPLAIAAWRNPLRSAIRKIATELSDGPRKKKANRDANS